MGFFVKMLIVAPVFVSQSQINCLYSPGTNSAGRTAWGSQMVTNTRAGTRAHTNADTHTDGA